jgi:hypothetical protein
MKKWMLAMLVMVLVIGSVSAEWRDYEWGMRPTEIRVSEDLTYMYGEEGSSRSVQVYVTTVMDQPTLASFFFEPDGLKAILLQIDGDIFETAVDIYRGRYGPPSVTDPDFRAWDTGSLYLSVELSFGETEIMYIESAFAERVREQQNRQAEDEL